MMGRDEVDRYIPTDTKDIKFLIVEDLRKHRDDYIKQEVIRLTFGLSGSHISPWAQVADLPVSWFHSQEHSLHGDRVAV